MSCGLVKNPLVVALAGAALAAAASPSFSAPIVSRLTPPSELFASGQESPVIARFAPGQRFDLQATVRPDPGQAISSARFFVDGHPVTVAPGATSLVTSGLVAGLPAGSAVASARAYSNRTPGIHQLTVTATQSNGQTVSATGNFEIVGIHEREHTAKNVIILLGDGMGAAHRTAARIMLKGYAQGKTRGPLAMDTFPVTGMVMTASLNSIVTDSAPGMATYVTGNKSANNQEGVFPDDTVDPFDNPRVEYLSQYLARTQGKSLGLVTTADVFDATPAANAVYTANRGAGTGIVDQYFDDRHLSNLKVLMGGGRKWFLPNPSNAITPQPSNGSQRRNATDYVLPGDIIAGWGSAPGALDPGRDLIAAFAGAGYTYVSNNTELESVSRTDKLLGLFALSNMNVALDKIGKRRGTSMVVDDYGFPDQPMLDEMAAKALQVLNMDNRQGFVLMIEGASIDKQAHNMDSERWILDTIEFDRAIQVVKNFALSNPDTLVIITADHECAGASIIGASILTDAALAGRSGINLRNGVVGTFDAAGFPRYSIAADGYPATTDIDRRMLIGYGANADRFENWRTNTLPLQDTQQPFVGASPLNTYPALPVNRDVAAGFMVTGQIADVVAAHTATDIPLSALGRGASMFTGVMDNTDVFFKLIQATVGGTAGDGERSDHREHDDDRDEHGGREQ